MGASSPAAALSIFCSSRSKRTGWTSTSFEVWVSVATGDQRRLHRGDVVLAELHVGATPLGPADRGCRGHPDDVHRVVPALHPQRHPEVGVGQDVLVDHARRALGGEDHVDAERASDGRHTDQRLQHVGIVLGQHRELVDHEQQAGHRLGRIGGQVGVEVVDALPRGGEDLLSVAQLGLERRQGAVGKLLVEVADGADRVGQPFAGLERRPALEVDQDERQPGRVVPGSQAGHHRSEELALPRAGGTADQAVRTVAHQVDPEHTVLTHPERSGDPGRAGPGPTDGGRAQLVDPQQRRQPDQAGQQTAGHRQLRVVEPRQVGGTGVSARHTDPGEHHVVDAGPVAGLG